MWAKLKEKIAEARLGRAARIKRANLLVEKEKEQEKRVEMEGVKEFSENHLFPTRQELCGTVNEPDIYGTRVQPVTNWQTVREEATYAKLTYELANSNTQKRGQNMYTLDLPEECSWAEKGERNFYTLSQPKKSSVRTVLGNYPLPFQRYIVLEFQVESFEGTFSVGFAPKPPVYDNVLGYYSNSIGLSAQGGLFAGSLKESLRTAALRNDGDPVTVTFLIDRDPDIVEGVVETAPGWGAMFIFVDTEMITERPIYLPILRLPAPFEPTGMYRIRSSNPARPDGTFETVACPRRSDWGELPALYAAVTFSNYCSFGVNFGQHPYLISRLDATVVAKLEKLLGNASFAEVLSDGRFGYAWDAQRLTAYRVSKLIPAETAAGLAVNLAQPGEDEDEEDGEDRCRFVNNLRDCKCKVFVCAEADLHASLTRELCASCGHGRMWHKPLPHEETQVGKKPLDERWAALEGKTSPWRKAVVASEIVYYNVKTRELTDKVPVSLRFRAEPQPATFVEDATGQDDGGDKTEESSESDWSGSRRRRNRRRSQSSRRSSVSDGGESVAISAAYVPVEIKNDMVPPRRAPSSAASKTPPSVVVSGDDIGRSGGSPVSVHRVFMPSVASMSAKMSNDSLKHDLDMYRRKVNLTRNALAEELMPGGERRSGSERKPKELRETVTRKKRMGQGIALVFAESESSHRHERRESGATIPTIKAAFSDFNVSRRTSGLL